MDNLVVNAVAPWQGFLHWVGNIREGNGRNGEYAFADFVLRYTDHKMKEKYITFSTGNIDNVEKLKQLQIGTPLRVMWYPESSEDQQRDRWYPSYQAYFISVIELGDSQPQPQKQQAVPQQAATPQSNEGWKNPYTPPAQPQYSHGTDDLPF